MYTVKYFFNNLIVNNQLQDWVKTMTEEMTFKCDIYMWENYSMPDLQ